MGTAKIKVFSVYRRDLPRAVLSFSTHHHILTWRFHLCAYSSEIPQVFAALAFKHLSIVFNTYQLLCDNRKNRVIHLCMTCQANKTIGRKKSTMSGLGTLSKLPPELRIPIFSYVLFDDDEEIPVVLTIHQKLSEYAERRSVLRLDRRAAEGRPSKPVAVKNSLLYVSKQISHETCQVLYGNHKFELGTAQTLDWFLVLIGDNRQHLRHVCVSGELGIRNLPAVDRITNNVLQAKNLRSLTLRPKVRVYVDLHGTIIRFFGDADIARSQIGAFITKLASVSENLLRSLRKAQKSEDKPVEVSDIFSLDFGAFGVAQEQLSAFWKSAVNSRINDST